MISNSREGDHSKFMKPLSDSRKWSGLFRNPRIVSVSRSLGVKDRHSKVSTMKGLRDRRITLSEPTAVQLYDLQDKLGLAQPSKVIDWLLEVTKHDIDNLPPLQFPQGFGEFHPRTSMAMPYGSSVSQFSLTPSFIDAAVALRVGNNNQGFNAIMPNYSDMDFGFRDKLMAEDEKGKGKCIKSTEDYEIEDAVCGYGNQVSAHQKIFHTTSVSLFPSSLINNGVPYSSYYSDPSSLCLSQFGSHETLSSQPDLNNGTAAMPSGAQLFFSPSFFASYNPHM